MKPFGTKALTEKYKSFYPGSWPAKPEATELVEAAIAAYLSNISNDDAALLGEL